MYKVEIDGHMSDRKSIGQSISEHVLKVMP
jgi:hypothetical protein